MSATAGDQVPMMPLVDVVVKTGAVVPWQMVMAVPKLNVGVMFGFTVMVNVAGSAQRPAVGVKV